MSSMTEEVIEVPLSVINQYFTCTLCQGYFTNAHSISECMHTFCRACVTKYFETGDTSSVSCPTCQIELGPYYSAVSKLAYDRNMQSCVDKLLATFMTDEIRANKRKFEDNQEELVTYRSFYGHKAPERQSSTASEGGRRQQGRSSASHHASPPLATVSKQSIESTSKTVPQVEGKVSQGTAALSDDVEFKVKLSAETTGPAEYIMPPLPKPSFRAKFDVKVQKILDFIYKRLDEDSRTLYAPEHIEILHDGQVIHGSDLKVLKTKSKVLQDGILNLTYRKKSK